MTSPRSDERGQVFVFTVLALTVLLGMTALALDVGHWFRTQRRLQGTADAAALAGAQALPDDPGNADALALNYAGQNGGGVSAADITISSTNQSNDTIFVKSKSTEPGFFSKIFGVDNVAIDARAKAIVGPPYRARYVAPMVVYCDHALIHNCNGNRTPDFGIETTLNYDPMGAPGAFGMLNLDGGSGTPGTSDEANWILKGDDKYLGLGDYRSDPGAKFSSNGQLQSALDARIGTVLLFPVYDTLKLQGQNATYDIIGWIGFHLDSYDIHGNTATLTGYFTEYIAQGIQAGSGGGSGSGAPSTFGVKTIQLIQ
jgi:Putative Flp pilus-assembly TadE/G-like